MQQHYNLCFASDILFLKNCIHVIHAVDMLLPMILYFSSDVIPILSIIVSVLTLAWAVTASSKARSVVKQCDRSSRKFVIKTQTKWDKVIYFIQSTLCMFLWRICTVGSRVIVLALALRVGLQGFNYSVLYGIVLTINAILLVLVPGIILYGVSTGTSKMKAVSSLLFVLVNYLEFCDNGGEFFFGVPRVESNSSRKQATVYYCDLFIVTVAVVITWYIMIPIKDDRVITVLLLPITSVLFILGIVFMMLHYLCCHHKREDIGERITCCELLFCKEDNDRSNSSSCRETPDKVKALHRVIGVIVVAFIILIVAVVVRKVFPYQA